MQSLHTLFDSFESFNDQVQKTFAESSDPLFQTEGPDLFETYLSAFPDTASRQHHNCSCCKDFLRRFGGLVHVSEKGEVTPALWADKNVLEAYAPVARALRRAVAGRKIVSPFLHSERMWGVPQSGGFNHFAVIGPAHKSLTTTAGQAMAQKREDFKTLSRALADFGPELLRQAMLVVKSGSLSRGEKFEGPIQFLLDLHGARALHPSRKRELTWFFVASAPPGFATPRSGMVGSLLEDLAAGKSFESVKRSFNSKMHPLQYQRPQAPATLGNIAQAEKIVEKMGIADSLRRRFARLDEIPLLWSPREEKASTAASGGVFAHLRQREEPKSIVASAPAMSWEKFVRTVLPEALSIEALVPSRGPFTAIVTASVPDAPEILKWPGHLSWYVYNNGSTASQWNLTPGTWVKVNGFWRKPQAFPGTIAILDGCVDLENGSLALFPETLKSELHSIRATIEEFSRKGRLEGHDEASACGLMALTTTFRVTTELGKTDYKIDRED